MLLSVRFSFIKEKSEAGILYVLISYGSNMTLLVVGIIAFIYVLYMLPARELSSNRTKLPGGKPDTVP